MFTKIKILMFILTCIFGTMNPISMFAQSVEIPKKSNQIDYVGAVIDEKCYIEPGKVYVAPDGIYINVNGNFVAVPCLHADEAGVYIVDVFGLCSYCGWLEICGICTNPDCPLKRW